MNQRDGEKVGDQTKTMPPASVMTRLILIMVWRKLIRNPNTYSSLFGLTWSLVSFKYELISFLGQVRGKQISWHNLTHFVSLI